MGFFSLLKEKELQFTIKYQWNAHIVIIFNETMKLIKTKQNLTLKVNRKSKTIITDFSH